MPKTRLLHCQIATVIRNRGRNLAAYEQ